MLYNAPSFTSLFCEVWTTGTPLSLSFHFKISPFKLWTFKQVALTCISVLPCASCLPSCQIHPHTPLWLSTNSCAHSPTGRGRTRHFWRSIFHCFSHPKQRCVFNFICRTLPFYMSSEKLPCHSGHIPGGFSPSRLFPQDSKHIGLQLPGLIFWS